MNGKEVPPGSISVDELINIIGRKEIQVQVLQTQLAEARQELARVRGQLAKQDKKKAPGGGS